MLGKQEGDVTADQIAKQARLIRLYRDPRAQIGAMPDPAPVGDDR